MLLEIGFIDSDELQKIQQHIDKFAPLIARAFCDFYGVQMAAGSSSSAGARPEGGRIYDRSVRQSGERF
jgi:hypothetical protein